MNNSKSYFLVTIILCISVFFIGKHYGKSNQYPAYSVDGLPSNCHAIIADNIKGYEDEIYSAEDALSSINRNCGISGYAWYR
jgi:hypothetical protein